MHVARDKYGNLICPVSMKTLTDNMRIVAIKTTGNVYAGSVVDDLNKKPKYWKDLLTDTPFNGSSDIIVLQDPIANDQKRLVSEFWYIKEKMKFDNNKMKGLEEEKAVIEHTGLGKRIMDQVEEKEEVEKKLKQEEKVEASKKIEFDPNVMISMEDFLKERHEQKDWKHTSQNTGRVAMGAISTMMDFHQEDEMRELKTPEM